MLFVGSHGKQQGILQRLSGVLGVEPSPDIAAIASVYFVQGVLGLSRLAVSFFLKDELHLNPADVALLTSIAAFPWMVKPLYGFLSDGLPLFGYRRRSYLVLCGLLGAGAWASLAALVHTPMTAAVAVTVSSLSVAVADVVVDSMVVERAKGESQAASGSLQSLCWGSSAIGGILSAYLGGFLVEEYGPRFVFGLTAALPLITSAVAILVNEDKVAPASESGELEGIALVKQQATLLWQTVRQRSIWLPALFVFLWQSTPHAETAMFYFTTNKLGFGPEFLGRVRLVTNLASLGGVTLYNTSLKDVPLRRILFWTCITGVGVGLTQLVLITGANRSLGISDQWFAMGDTLVITALGQIAFMPILVLAAQLCPDGVEATLFATLMSISNAGGVFGGALGAMLTKALGVTSTEFDNLGLLVLLCNLSSLLPLPFLAWLPSTAPEKKE
eukprot:jgi/Chlat1/1980/Chrsp158S00126